MVKGNNEIHNQHFKKDWQNRVRTWFNQPAKKSARRAKRVTVAKKMAPRPLNKLRPIVRCATVKYNTKVRAGRGFTLDELKAAKVNRYQAKTIGICVDFRRKNKNEEAFQQNVDRLMEYTSKLVLFPRKHSKNVKKGDSSVEDCKAASQCTLFDVLPIVKTTKAPKARKITKEEKAAKVTAVLRKALTDDVRFGPRAAAAIKKAAAAKK